MELNKEIKQILLDYVQISEENKWTKEQKDIRATYDTFRIQNIVENLTIPSVGVTCCEPIPKDSFYLGMTCPKCRKPFRQNHK